MLSLILHAAGGALIFAGGFFTHYKWGATLAKDVDVIKTAGKSL